MLMLSKPRAFLPGCLALGALLGALPSAADPPPAPVVSASAVQTQTIFLQHVVLGDIMKALLRTGPDILPEGVTQLSLRPDTNSLVVVATPAGLAKVQEVVKRLDIAPRQVQVRFALANTTAADLKASGVIFEAVQPPSRLTLPMPATKYAAGKEAALYLQTLTKQGAVTQAPILSTTNSVDARISISSASPAAASTVMFAATPRVNSDGSVTLVLHSSLPDGEKAWEINTLRTVKSGETMMFTKPASAPNADGKNLLLFVTPTLVSNTSHPSATP